MDVLNENKNEDVAIFRAHVKRTLQEHSAEMNNEIVSEMAGFTEAFWQDRKITSDEYAIIYQHRPQHRFIDMKYIRVNGRKVLQNRHEIHNKIIMTHFNGIQLDLTYGLTEQVKEQLRLQFDGKTL